MASTSNNDSDGLDYNEEGRRLLELVASDPANWQKLYADSTILYTHHSSGGTIHVGNLKVAKSLDMLNAMGPPCRRIVHCMESPGFETREFRNNPEFQYLNFPIATWQRTLGAAADRDNPTKVVEYFQPLFDFLDAELAAGRSILIHCLAGAHRAGTAGIASLMYLKGMTAEEATQAAQNLRPLINPIGDFPQLLKALEEGLKLRKQQANEPLSKS